MRTHRAVLLVLSFLFVFAGLSWFSRHMARVDRDTELPGVSDLPSEEDEALDTEDADATVVPRLQAVGALSGASDQQSIEFDAPLVRCEVRDHASRAPLSATLRSASGVWTCTDDGTALVPCEPEVVLVVQHPGYREQKVNAPATPSTPLLVLLRAEAECSVEVVDELGELQPDVEIRQVAVSNRLADAIPAQEWSRAIAETGPDGAATIQGATTGWVFAARAGQTSRLVALVSAVDRRLRITLPSARCTEWGVRRPDGTPLAFFDVQLRDVSSLGLPAVHLTSNATGQLPGPLPLGAYLLDVVPWGTVELSIGSGPMTSTFARRRTGVSSYRVRVDFAPEDDIRWIEVRHPSELLVEVRNPSGNFVQPLEFRDELGTRDASGELTWARVSSTSRVRVHGPRFSLSIFGKTKTLGDPDYRIVIVSPGYRAIVLDAPLVPDADGVTRLTLSPQDRKYTIRALDSTGRPYAGRIRVRDMGRAWHLFDGYPDPETGRVGPLVYEGPGDLEVLRRSGSAFQTAGRVSFEALEADPAPVVVVCGTASIRVLGAAAECQRVRVVGEDRRVWCPEPEGADLVVAGLWPGRYAVVDEGSVPSTVLLIGDLPMGFAPMTREELLPVELRDGDDRVVALPDAPVDLSFRGRVHIPHDLDGPLFLYPRETDRPLPRQPSEGARTWALSSSGHYLVEGLSFVPSELVLMRVDGVGNLFALGSFVPGEDYHPIGSRVVLHLSGLPDSLCVGSTDRFGSPQVAYKYTAGSERVDLGWFSAGPMKVLVLDPKDRTAEFQVDVSGSGETVMEQIADENTRATWASALPTANSGASMGGR
jgi:hypothetical protein